MNKEINRRLTKLDEEIKALRNLVFCEEKDRRKSIPTGSFERYERRIWTTFERDLVINNMVDFIDELSMKTNRTILSVKWEIYRQLKTQLGI